MAHDAPITRVVPPTSTQITSPYGPRRSSADGQTRMHNGIDLAGVDGRTPVVSIAPGVVVHATPNGARGFSCYGHVVVVHHTELGVWSLYAHLASVLVQRGEDVDAGSVIGTVGSTNGSPAHPGTTFRDGRCLPGGELGPPNRASGPHLHFEVSARRYPMPHSAPRLDPVAWLAEHGVRYSSDRRGGRPLPLASEAPAPSGDDEVPRAPRSIDASSALGGGALLFLLLLAARKARTT